MPPKKKTNILNPIGMLKAAITTQKAEEQFKTKAEAARAKVADHQKMEKKRKAGIAKLAIMTGEMKEETKNATIAVHVQDGLKGRMHRKQKTPGTDRDGFVTELWPAMKTRIEVNKDTNKAKEIIEEEGEREEFKFKYNSGLYTFITNTRLRMWWVENGDDKVEHKRGCFEAILKWFSDWHTSSKESEPLLFRKDIREIEARFGGTIAGYFIFARELFFLNIIIAIVYLLVLNIPWWNAFSSPTYMQFYWPQVNVTGSGPEHMDKLNISLSFFSFLTGKGMENTALFFGGYRVNQNQTGGFQFDAGDTLNATHLNVTEQMLFNNKSYLTESDLSNEELLNECPDQLFVCKATTDALVADAVNESAVGEEEETTDLSNMDTTDVLYALCVFFTFTFSILKIVESLGDTWEERYDAPPDEFSYDWGPVVFGALSWGVQSPAALRFYRSAMDQALSGVRSKDDEKHKFEDDQSCKVVSLLYLRRATGMLITFLLIVISITIIGTLTLYTAEVESVIADSEPALAPFASFLVPIFVAMVNIITPQLCKILVALEKWPKATALTQTLWRVYIMKIVNVCVLLFVTLQTASSPTFSEAACPENFVGKTFWTMVFMDSLVQFVVKILVAAVMYKIKFFGGLPLAKQKIMFGALHLAALKAHDEQRAKRVLTLIEQVDARIEDKKLKEPTLKQMLQELKPKGSGTPRSSRAGADTELVRGPEESGMLSKLHDDIKLDVKLRVSQGARTEFDVAAQIIDLMYKQALIWGGSPYSPMLPLLGTLNMLVAFFITKYNVLWFGKNSAANTGAGNTDRFNLMLLFSTVLVTLYCAIQFLSEDHTRCGPFVRVDGARYQVFGIYLEAGILPRSVTKVLDTLMKPTTLLVLIVLALITIYFEYKEGEKQQRNLGKALKMLSDENEEKKHIILMNNINMDESKADVDDSDEEDQMTARTARKSAREEEN